jgi:hypothetical protein
MRLSTSILAGRTGRSIVVILSLLVSSVQAANENPGQNKIALRVLYAGNPASDRSRDFATFLEQHFETVQTGDYEKFKPEDANGFDVVVFDWTSIYPRDENGKISWDENLQLAQPQPPKIDRNFSRPCVLIGAAAGTLSHQLQTAINWKCLCLENFAHDTDTDHAMFREPIPISLEFERREKPLDYYVHPGTEKIGETIQVWKVQEKSFPEIDPGLVSSRENFTHTPDAEVISGGINGKGPTSVAIGRHGNFLLWGFSGEPSEMTELGRNAFINAVCYIQKFDGKTPGPAEFGYGGRDTFLEQVYGLRTVSDEYLEKQGEQFREMVRENPPPEKQLQEIGDDPVAYFRKMLEPYAKQTKEKLPKAVRDACGEDTEQLIRYYRENLEYLRANGNGEFLVDEDVQTLGVSNRSPELLEKCVALLEAGEQAELAARVLKRYTQQSYSEPAEWRRWLEQHAANLRFDENRGVFTY